MRDAVGCVILVASHYLENIVSSVGNRKEAHHLMRHRNRQKVFGNLPPIANNIIFFVRPVEDKFRVDRFTARMSEITHLVWIHCDEKLNKRKNTFTENTMP